MVYLILLFAVLVVAVFAISLYMYFRDKKHPHVIPSKKQRIAQAIPPYELCTWIDEEVAARRLYSKPGLTAAGLADELGLSESRLKKIINNAYDKTVAEYLDDRRIQRACRLLRELPDISIADICAEIGFVSPKTFQGLFEQTMGQTPDEYRRQMMKKADTPKP